MTTQLSCSRSYPVTVEDAFEPLITAPLDHILGTRHLVIPGVRRVVQDERWGQRVGQQRTLQFTDGGSTRETLTRLESPRAFGYTLDQVRGPMVALITTLDGTWSLDPVGTGCRITWTWDLTPANRVAALAMPAFARAWAGAARKAFDRLEPLLVA